MITYIISHHPNSLYYVKQMVDGEPTATFPRSFRTYGEARTYALDKVGQDESRVKVEWS